MKAKFDANTNTLIVEVPLDQNKTSRSGNSTVIATTHGQQLLGAIDGKPTYLQLNVLQMEAATGMLEIEGMGEDTRIHDVTRGEGDGNGGGRTTRRKAA